MTTSPSDPAALADQLERSYEVFWRTLNLLEPEEWERPCLANGWSPKVLIAHIAFWDDFQLRRMQAALTGAWAEAVPRPADDNDARARRDATRAWDEVVAEADANRQRLVDFARGLTPDQVDAGYRESGEMRPVLQILLPHMAKHVRIHTADLFAYCGSLQRWGRDGLRSFLFQQQKNLLDSIGGLSEETLTTILVSGAWTVRDVLVHVLGWEEYVVEIVRRWPDTDLATLARWRDAESLDAVNQRLQAELAALEMIPLLDALATAHRRLLNRYDDLSDEELCQEGEYGWGMHGTLSSFLYRMAHHTAEHAAEIWQARAEGILVPDR